MIKEKSKYKSLLIVCLIIFAFMMGLNSLLRYLGTGITAIYYIAYFLLFALCAFLLVRSRQSHIDPLMVFKFFACMIVGETLLWAAPWEQVGYLAASAKNMLGIEVATIIYYFIGAFCVVCILVLSLMATSKTIPKGLLLFIVRVLLLALLASFVVTVFSNIFLFPLQSTDTTLAATSAFIKNTLTHITLGVVYYFVTVSFMGDVRSIGRAKQSQ